MFRAGVRTLGYVAENHPETKAYAKCAPPALA